MNHRLEDLVSRVFDWFFKILINALGKTLKIFNCYRKVYWVLNVALFCAFGTKLSSTERAHKVRNYL